jgi:hypothetical protein
MIVGYEGCVPCSLDAALLWYGVCCGGCFPANLLPPFKKD